MEQDLSLNQQGSKSRITKIKKPRKLIVDGTEYEIHHKYKPDKSDVLIILQDIIKYEEGVEETNLEIKNENYTERQIKMILNYLVKKNILLKNNTLYKIGPAIIDVLGAEVDQESFNPQPVYYTPLFTKRFTSNHLSCIYKSHYEYKNNEVHSISGSTNCKWRTNEWNKSKALRELLQHIKEHHKEEIIEVCKFRYHYDISYSYIIGLIQILIILNTFPSKKALNQLHKVYDVPLIDLTNMFPEIFSNNPTLWELDISPKFMAIIQNSELMKE